ncbi:hypothetical protein K3740_08760 [Ruegeria conchae]|uniref:hypothetical protein n=1 Tax=Ruegeria conchae TaxID=981384 RepID=UPI0021A6BFF8|nr:hypothetical protein [Ruegeria conchae]UWR04751.1 hypothetical protein K3740_08760 [Ruegeria conchae]
MTDYYEDQAEFIQDMFAECLQPFVDQGVRVTVSAVWLNAEEIAVQIWIAGVTVIETVIWSSAEGVLDTIYEILWRHRLDLVRLMLQHEANPQKLDRLFFSPRLAHHHPTIELVRH